ncbi:serine hydrolase domain-containing protein [Derxia lacustris]|uniref:serine hydrolase domain-containing protein n=1 Tax=Derxia lacustris TaxID=764842 RepID=UPI000A16EF88|nr:serine hydrolase domain-containing protein [Derxia lacustris]
MNPSSIGAPALSRRKFLQTALAVGLGAASLAACGGGDDAAPASPPTADAARRAVTQGLVGVAMGWREPGIQQLSVAGLRNLGGQPLRSDDLLYLGSNGKAMTAMTIARLVEQGRLGWQWRIADVLPTLAAAMRADYANVTLAQWLDHLGGVVPLTGSGDDEERLLADVAADPEPLPDGLHDRRLYVARWTLQQPPVDGIVPGRDYAYSNAGYLIAALMAEAVTGQEFEALLQANLVEPLGLRLSWAPFSALAPEAPHGYEGASPTTLAWPDESDPLYAILQQVLAPAGYWACTADSYAHWIDTLLKALRGEPTALPAGAVARLRSLPSGSYALGWLAQQLPGVTVLAHTGHVDGFMTEAVLDRAGSWAGFGLTNTAWSDPADGSSWVMTTLDKEIAALARARGKLPPTAARFDAMPSLA